MKDYKIYGYKTESCGNLYAFCIERANNLLNQFGKFGMIVPNSSISALKMRPLQKIVTTSHECWISNYSWRPSKLFEGADMLLAIIINSKTYLCEKLYSTQYQKWYNEYRITLFETIAYNSIYGIHKEGTLPKLSSMLVISILNKLSLASPNMSLEAMFVQYATNYIAYYFRAVQYWFKVLAKTPVYIEDGENKVTGEMKPVFFKDETQKNVAIALLSSSLFFVYYIMWSSCQVVNSRDFDMAFNFASMDKELAKEIASVGCRLQSDYQKNSHIMTRYYSKKGRSFTMKKQHFFIKYSKPIIDEIDELLAKHYGFTEEELDFIINYDIKYRMGDKLNEEE